MGDDLEPASARPPVPAKPSTPEELGGLAVLFHRLAGDQRALLDYLASTLAVAMPEAVRVQRDHLFNRGPANHVEVLLGAEVFDLRLEHGQLVPAIGEVVGGVALSRTVCAVEAWVDRLVAALDAAARSSDAVRAALSRLT